MPTAKKLPSGSYRVRIYSHTDSSGKQIYQSFTAPTKKQAELQALEWKNKHDRHQIANLTVYEAVEGYISAKEGVLSPSTIRGYVKILKNNYTPIGNVRIDKLTSETLQIFISDLSKEKSPKTVRNIYGLLVAAIGLYLPDKVFRITLPQKSIKKEFSPSNEDVSALYESASPELKKCIALAAFGSLRRGEICALTFSDLNGNTLSITKDMIQGKDNKWVVKDIPKTAASVREVRLPQKVVDLLGSGEPNEKIIKYKTPGSITQCFTKLRDRTGVNIHFHQLRKFYASIGAVLGIPDTFLSDFGGWSKSSKVMKDVYQHKIVSMSDLYANKLSDYFNGII